MWVGWSDGCGMVTVDADAGVGDDGCTEGVTVVVAMLAVAME